MEQGIQEDEQLLLRFKYYTFFDLNPKVRYSFSILSFLKCESMEVYNGVSQSSKLRLICGIFCSALQS